MAEVTSTAVGTSQRPAALSKGAWKAIAKRVVGEIKRDHLTLLAGGISFYAFIAIFPALAAALLVYGLIADPQQVQQQVLSFAGALPGEVTDIIERFLNAPARSDDGALTGGLVLAIGGALWTASAGVAGLVEGINAAYNEVDERPFLKKRGLALLLTFGAIAFIAVAVGLIAVLPIALQYVGLAETGKTLLNVLRWPFLALAIMAAVAILYRVGPDRESPTTRWRSTGAIAATILFLVISGGFSLYVSSFGGANSYQATYGALAGVVILLFWLFLSAFAILLGAEINAEIEHQRAIDRRAAGSTAIGRKDPYLADTR